MGDFFLLSPRQIQTSTNRYKLVQTSTNNMDVSLAALYSSLVLLCLKLTDSLHVSEYKDLYQCTNDKRLTNGCNFAFDDFRRRFTPACNMHDICYYCGMSQQLSRGDCDEIFYDQMMQTCAGDFGCEIHAFLYFTGTSIFGSSFYFDDEVQVCKRTCIQGVLTSLKKSSRFANR